MASLGFLAWLEKKRALRSAREAEGGGETLTTKAGSVLDVSHPSVAPVSPSTSAKDQRSPRLDRDPEEQSEMKPLAPPEAKKTAARPVETDSGRSERQQALKQPMKAQQSKKRPRSPPTTAVAAAEPLATPEALSKSPAKRRKLSDGDENKCTVVDATLARDRPRGLSERPRAAVNAHVPEKKAKQTPTVELRTPIPIPTLLPLDAAVDWDLDEASMLLEAPTKRSSMLPDQKSKKRRETDALELERPLNGSDFSFWRAVDRFYDLDEE